METKFIYFVMHAWIEFKLKTIDKRLCYVNKKEMFAIFSEHGLLLWQVLVI